MRGSYVKYLYQTIFPSGHVNVQAFKTKVQLYFWYLHVNYSGHFSTATSLLKFFLELLEPAVSVNQFFSFQHNNKKGS